VRAAGAARAHPTTHRDRAVCVARVWTLDTQRRTHSFVGLGWLPLDLDQLSTTKHPSLPTALDLFPTDHRVGVSVASPRIGAPTNRADRDEMLRSSPVCARDGPW
jgi:hypothetical protein